MSDWVRVKEIFQELIERPAGDRGALLDKACGGDPGLRANVAALLASHDDGGGFMDSPTLSRSGGLLRRAEIAAPDLPSRIGTYVPLECIGEGGFGTVYRARQESPIRRIVAIKVIKPGLDSREVIARFEGERQALAIMSHPNIASAFDAGTTEQGRPYFVMEYVPGEPITHYCDKEKLSLRRRLELFVQVCGAVQHAHTKGVIHRDLKPGNMLVNPVDGRAVVKVIDFGVAKATEQRLTDQTIVTQRGMFVGTPEYMSPEQAELGQLDIDTRTDVYSLGVLLYELLTGTLPFDSKTLRSQILTEIQRIIRELEPPRPSTRPGGAGKETAAQRSTDSRGLAKSIRGDLDWIVMKCLEKDRARRYQTANDLALEIGRYLNDEPVIAGPPTLHYRIRKFGRRHRAAVLAAAGIATALLIGLGLSLAGFVAARRSADESRRAARKAEAVNQFLQDMLASADPKNSGERDMTVREALDRAVVKLDAGNMQDQPEIEADVRLTIGRAYAELAEFETAEKQVDSATSTIRSLSGNRSIEYARALEQRGTVRQLAAKSAEAEPDFRAALEIFHAERAPSREIASCMNDLACSLMSLLRSDEAKPLLNEAIRLARLPENAGRPILGESLNNLGLLFLLAEDLSASEPLFREAVEVNRRTLGEIHPNVATNLDNLAQIAIKRGDMTAAEAPVREALEIRRKLLGPEHPDVAMSLHNLAFILFGKKDLAGAEELLWKSLAALRRVRGPNHPDTLTVVDSLVSITGAAGKLEVAEGLLLDTVKSVRDDVSVPDERKASFVRRLTELYQAWGKADRAAEWSAELDRLQAAAPAASASRPTPE